MTNKTMGRDYDRDKNLTYRPQDESGDWSTEPLVKITIAPNQSIVTILLKLHEKLRDFTAIVKANNTVPVEKQNGLLNLIDLWCAYVTAEENALYDETAIASEKHKHVDTEVLIEELENLNFRFTWNEVINSKALVLAQLVDKYLLFEEEIVFTKIENLLVNEDQLRLGREFIRQFEAAAFHQKASLKPSRIII